VRCIAVRQAGSSERLSSLGLTLNKILRFDEIFIVETYYHVATQRLEESLCRLRDAHRQLEGRSRKDSLTLVNNRQALMEALALEFHRSRRYQHGLALLFLDVDHFKKINDRHGHVFGDQVLFHVAQSAGKIIRPSDIIGRYGGEEFVIGLVECDRTGALQIAERIRMKIAQEQFALAHHATAVTVSIGVAMLSPEIDRIETLITRADEAMYDAKCRGRNRVELYREVGALKNRPG
jgi:diguanylate cyclase (GGDEF)-like protein